LNKKTKSSHQITSHLFKIYQIFLLK